MKDVDIFDLFFRNSIGFDGLSNFFAHSEPSYPRYNIIRNGKNNYLVEVALAGYDPNDITVDLFNGYLRIYTKSQESKTSESEAVKNTTPGSVNPRFGYLHRGIAKRDFSLTLAIDENIEVQNAEFNNGLLVLSLVQHVPELPQPKQIPITIAGQLTQPKLEKVA